MPSTRREIERIYREHPLRLATILARVQRDRGTLTDLTESILATDERTGITDQNNVGGAPAVLRLARDAGITATDHVLDLGCGLGGPARLLADTFGCRVTGIDLSRGRAAEARTLTDLVSLSRLVSIRAGDMMRAHVPRHAYDVVWGQSAWMHVDNPGRLVARWTLSLRDQGRMVVQDSGLRRPPRTPRERALVRRLERDWSGHLWPAAAWAGFARSAGLDVVTFRRSSAVLVRHFRHLARSAERSGSRPPARETRSWCAAIEAAEQGLLTYFTVIAARSSGHQR